MMANMRNATSAKHDGPADCRPLLAALACLLLAGSAFAADLGAGKMYEAIRAETAPVIDGKLDDAVWQKATASGEFWKLTGSLAAMQQTYFQIAYDSDNLYLAITNMEANPEGMKGEVRVDDMTAVMGDEANEWFLQPEIGGAYYQFAANCLGTKYDGLGFDSSWGGKWQCAAARGPDKWTLECAIAFASFGRFGVPGATWGLNVCRDRQAGGDTEWSAWSPTPGGFHQPGNFGRLIFGGQSGGGIDRAALIECARAAMKSFELERRLGESMATIRTGNLQALKPEERQTLDAQIAQGKQALEGLRTLLASDKPLDTRAWIEINALMEQALRGLEEAAWQVRFETLLAD
jgi:hypothetical protein